MTTPISCVKVGCTETKGITYNKPLCYPHWLEFDAMLIFECEKCHRFDELVGEFSDEDWCVDCFRGENVPVAAHGPVLLQDLWLYIVKLDRGELYVGQTNDLEVRVQEHKDGRTRSTAGRNPRLVWFAKWGGGRKDLQAEEANIRQEIRESPRTILQMIADWQRLVRLVDLER